MRRSDAASLSAHPDLLDIWVDDPLGRRCVGTLERVAEPNHPYQARVLFHYADGLHNSDAVSLLMPIRRETYSSPRAGMVDNLLPIFDQNLPEGALRDYLIRRYQKVIPHMADFDVLRLVGHHGIGRVRAVTHGIGQDQAFTADAALYPLRALMADMSSEALLTALFERLSEYSGVSGAQPKVLLTNRYEVRHDARLDVVKPSGSTRLTVRDEYFIIKTAAQDFPWLTINEHLCLYAAQMAGLDAVTAHLSDDGGILAVQRFDRDAQTNVSIGFEDAGCVAGLTAYDKYTGSYESLVEHLTEMLPRENQPAARQALFKSMALNVLIGNGDAHHKNFGVSYADPTAPARLAPVFDVCCTTAYIRQDHLALTLGGSKAFPSRAKLERFGRLACSMTPAQVSTALDDVLTGIELAGAELAYHCKIFPDFANTCGNRMREIWRDNIVNYFKPASAYELPRDISEIGKIQPPVDKII